MPWEGDVVAKVGRRSSPSWAPPTARRPASDSSAGATPRRRASGATATRGVTVSAYIGRYGWNVFPLDGTVPAAELRELVDASYDAIVSKLPKAQRPPAS